MKSKHYGIIAGGIVGIGVLAALGFRGDVTEQLSLAALGLSFSPPSVFEQTLSSDELVAGSETGVQSVPSSGRYVLDTYFSLAVPDGFRFRDFQDESGIIVLAESPGESFQVFIASFDEPGPLTPERIKKDLPQKVINNPRVGTLDGTEALAFTSREEGVGDVFEVWFVREGSLYQITAEAGFADRLQHILETWQFAESSTNP